LYDSLEHCVEQIDDRVATLQEIRAGRATRQAVSPVNDTGWTRRGPQMDQALARAVHDARKKNS